MRPLRTPLALLIIPAVSVVESLLVVPSSPQCAVLCGNEISSTSGAEMTCSDSAYGTSQFGATFKACLDCEMASTYFDPVSRASDLQWAIYNLRYALSWCLFGFANNTQGANSPCLTSFSCAPLQTAFEYDGLNPNSSTYSFCPALVSQRDFVPRCSECLAETGNEDYLSNYVTALDAACIQQPAPGKTISIDGTVFSSTKVNITSPSSTPISTYHPSTGALTLGAKIGIAVAGLVVVLAIAGCCIIWRGKRRRRATLKEAQRQSGYAEWQARNAIPHYNPQSSPPMGPGGPISPFFDSPASQRPLTKALSWDQGNSPESYTAEKAYFSPYSSNYNSPVSALDGPSHAGTWNPDYKGMGLAISEEREPGERIEMVGVADPRLHGWQRSSPAPVLQHPGPGRMSVDAPRVPASPGLSEEDARMGRAV